MNLVGQIVDYITQDFEGNFEEYFQSWMENQEHVNLHTSLNEEIDKVIQDNPTEFSNLDPRQARIEAARVVCYKQFNSFINRLSSSLRSNDSSLFVYRSISVDNATEYIKKLLFSNELSSLGKHWSWTSSKAQSYEGDYKNFSIVFWGMILKESINLKTTIEKGLSLTYASENELVLLEGQPILIYQIVIKDSSGAVVTTKDNLKIKALI